MKAQYLSLMGFNPFCSHLCWFFVC